MPDDSELADFDPYDTFDEEAARLTRWFLHRTDGDWHQPTRCEGWDVADLLAHLAGGEEYNQACLDGKVGEYMEAMGKAGVTSMDEANAKGVTDRRGRPPQAVLDEWQHLNADTRRRLRDRGNGEVATSVGPYPAQWQAWHLASELATHADDADVPITDTERDERNAWRGAFARFALEESHPELTVTKVRGQTLISDPDGDLTVTLDDETLIEATNNRLDGSVPLDESVRSRLSTV